MNQQPSILIIDGPDKGLAVALSDGASVLGRDRSCRISVSDLQVSRVHAEIEKTGDSFRIKDRGSANGTRLNGTRIKEPGHDLADGDLISIGNTTMRFRMPAPAAMTIVEDLSKTQSISMDASGADASLREGGGGVAELKRAKADLQIPVS